MRKNIKLVPFERKGRLFTARYTGHGTMVDGHVTHAYVRVAFMVDGTQGEAIVLRYHSANPIEIVTRVRSQGASADDLSDAVYNFGTALDHARHLIDVWGEFGSPESVFSRLVFEQQGEVSVYA